MLIHDNPMFKSPAASAACGSVAKQNLFPSQTLRELFVKIRENSCRFDVQIPSIFADEREAESFAEQLKILHQSPARATQLRDGPPVRPRSPPGPGDDDPTTPPDPPGPQSSPH